MFIIAKSPARLSTHVNHVFAKKLHNMAYRSDVTIEILSYEIEWLTIDVGESQAWRMWKMHNCRSL